MAEPPIKQNIQNCFTCSGRIHCIFSDSDPSCLMELGQMQQRSIYPRGAVIFTEGDQPQGVYIVCSGLVKLSIYSPDGRSVIVSTATTGDLLGIKALLSEKPHNLTAQTFELTQVCFIKKDDFLDFLRRNGNVS